MEPEREGNVQQINKKIDHIWEQAREFAERIGNVMEFLQGPRPATPGVDDTAKQQMGWLGRTNDGLENIIVVLDECVIQVRRLQEEGFISNATQERYGVIDQERLGEIQRRMQEVQEPSPEREVNNG